MDIKLKDKLLCYQRILFFVAISFISTHAHAATTNEILKNLQDLIDPLFRLVNAISLMLGIGLMFRGLGMLKAFGMPLTQATRPGELAGPMVYIIVGSVLLYLPFAANVAGYTVFGEDAEIVALGEGQASFLEHLNLASEELVSYTPSGIEGKWSIIIDTIVHYVSFIGYLAFIRGWLIISTAGQPGVQPGTLPKGLIHIFGGILAINFLFVVEILNNTFIGYD